MADGSTYSHAGKSFLRVKTGKYAWPAGTHYIPYTYGERLPAAFWLPDYVIDEYGEYGLTPPSAGFEWVRYGPDILEINSLSGQVIDAIQNAFDDSAASPDDDQQAQPAPDQGPDASQQPAGTPDDAASAQAQAEQAQVEQAQADAAAQAEQDAAKAACNAALAQTTANAVVGILAAARHAQFAPEQVDTSACSQ